MLMLLPFGAVAQEPPQAAGIAIAICHLRLRAPTPTPEASPTPRDPMSTPTFNGLRLRSIGPAFTSGRISGFAVDPTNPSRYYVAVASGGVWKTINAGINMDADLRQRSLLFDRRDRARSEKPADGLGRHRREQQPAQRFLRQRSL